MTSQLPQHLWSLCPDCGNRQAPDDPCLCHLGDPDAERDAQMECPSNYLDVEIHVDSDADLPF